jgi:hypothetical protein
MQFLNQFVTPPNRRRDGNFLPLPVIKQELRQQAAGFTICDVRFTIGGKTLQKETKRELPADDTDLRRGFGHKSWHFRFTIYDRTSS